MEIAIRNITRDNLGDIPGPCKKCLYWEFPEDLEKLSQQEDSGSAEAKKRAWFVKTLRTFGDCGKIVYQGKTPIGYAQYAPFTSLPQARNYKSLQLEQLEAGAVFISCLYITEETQRGTGVGTRLLQSVLSNLRRRGFQVVETFARRGSANNPSGPIEIYLKNGFRIKDETDPEFPLVRLEL